MLVSLLYDVEDFNDNKEWLFGEAVLKTIAIFTATKHEGSWTLVCVSMWEVVSRWIAYGILHINTLLMKYSNFGWLKKIEYPTVG